MTGDFLVPCLSRAERITSRLSIVITLAASPTLKPWEKPQW